MLSKTTHEHTLVLQDEERNALAALLKQALTEMRTQKRRAEAFDFREQLSHEQQMLQSLFDKVQHLGGAAEESLRAY